MRLDPDTLWWVLLAFGIALIIQSVSVVLLALR